MEIEKKDLTQIDDNYLFRILMINKAKNQYALLSVTRKLNSKITYYLTIDEYN